MDSFIINIEFDILLAFAMAGSLNKVILIGNLGRDPEIKFLPDGTKIANFSIATSEFWKDKTTGERKERTEWHRIAVYNERLSDIVEKYIKKGSKVYIEGQLQTRKWTDQSGAERYTTEVVIPRFRGDLILMDAKRLDSEYAEDQDFDQVPPASSAPLDDNIPF